MFIVNALQTPPLFIESVTADMLSAVNEYQGLRPVTTTGVRDPYLCIIGWHIR